MSVSPKAKIGQNVEIKPFVYIEDDVEIGDNCTLMPGVSILNGTRIGKGNVIHQNTVIGADPQDFHAPTDHKWRVIIGDNNVIRENVVIAGGYREGRWTEIGSNNFLMDRVHLCHDVHLHDNTVIGIGVSIAGECTVGKGALLSSSALLQQHVRIGRYALVQSACCLQKDVPPFVIMGGQPAAYHGIYAKPLQEELHVSEDTMKHIINAYRIIYTGNFSIEDAIARIKEQPGNCDEIQSIIKFVETAQYGICRNIHTED
ncbi:MAG: acyl-ACP--UDP-N-acetylglucosamine O-acyltransferase [Bacteroidaceae bacterium]|nr:acyl-ACP--UDP-N-acetylglucosamine O-acyltransferase [Candidatus Equimonas faecalis]MCQ2206110.1 acyl-ACP--UDP-N-acetylglucosamine O-acyltransferase [Bacteroidaceae bacterium]